MTEGSFMLIALGPTLLMLVIAMLAGHFNGDGNEELLDWRPTRSPKRESELQVRELDQMLSALNRYRRQRGAPERSLKEVVEEGSAGLRLYFEALLPPE
jgi:hypothetical protein